MKTLKQHIKDKELDDFEEDLNVSNDFQKDLNH